MSASFTTVDKYKPYCKLDYKYETEPNDKYRYILETKPYIFFLVLDSRTGILDQHIVNTQTGRLITETVQINAPLPVKVIVSKGPNIVFISNDAGFHYTCYKVVILDDKDPVLVKQYTSSILDEQNTMVYHSGDDKIYYNLAHSQIDSNVIKVYKFSYETGFIEKYETKNRIDQFKIYADSKCDFIAEDVIIYKDIPLCRDNSVMLYIYNLKTGTLVSLDFFESLGIPEQTYAYTATYTYIERKAIYINKCYYFIMLVDNVSFGIYKLSIKPDNPNAHGFVFDGIPELLCKYTYMEYSNMNLLYELDGKLYMIDYVNKPTFSIYMLDLKQQEPMLDLNPQEPSNYTIQRILSSYEFELENMAWFTVNQEVTSMQDIFEGKVTSFPYEYIDDYYKCNDKIQFEYICSNPGHSLESIVIRDGNEYKFFKLRLDTVSDISGVRDMANKLELDLPDEILLDIAKLVNRPEPRLEMSLDYTIEQYNLANPIRADTVYNYSIQEEYKNPWIPEVIDGKVHNGSIESSNLYAWNNSARKPISTKDYDEYMKKCVSNTPEYKPKTYKWNFGMKYLQFQIHYPPSPQYPDDN